MASDSHMAEAIPSRRTTRVMLLREYERWRLEAQRWRAVGQAVLRWQAGYEMDNLLNEAMRDCAQAWGALACAVLALDAERAHLVLRASVGLDISAVHPILVAADNAQALSQAAEEYVPQWLAVRSSAPGRRAFSIFPLTFHQMPLGVLFLCQEAGKKEDDDEAENAAWRALAAQIACALFWEEVSRRLHRQERVEIERNFGHMLKSRLLSPAPPSIDGYRLGVRCLRCLEVSGDFWDFLPQTDGRLIFLLGEITGRGSKAAINVARIMLKARGLLAQGLSLSAAVVALNREVVEEGGRGQMANICLGEFDPAKRRLNLARGGTIRAVFGKDGESRIIAGGGTPLGVLSDYAVTPTTLSLPPGAALLLVTDGFGQCENPEGNRYSTEHLLNFLADYSRRSVGGDQALAVCLADSIEQHAGGAIPKDDIALFSIECLK